MSPQVGWILKEEVVPRLRAVIPKAVKSVGAEDPEELIQDATVMAAQMMERNERRGKKVTPGNIAYYTLQHLKSGRRANGSSVMDVMATGTQLNGSARLHSFSEVVSESEAGNEIFELQDVISNDHEDPSMQAARQLDWDSFLTGLNKMERLVVEFLGAGKTLRAAARKVGVGDATMQRYRRQLAVKLWAFMGADILQDIVRLPGWKNGLNADRERLACRLERRLA